MNLEDYRTQIDEIDAQLVDLFERRMAAAAQIARIKHERGLPVMDAAREARVLAARKALLSDVSLSAPLEDFLSGLMSVSRAYQRSIYPNATASPPSEPRVFKAAYSGIKGSYGEEAAAAIFGEDQIAGTAAFDAVFKLVDEGRAEFGVLPLDNSSTGSITEVYDLLTAFDCHIHKELRLDIRHCLLGVRGAALDDIEEVYSHPQGISQSRDFLNNYPNWRRIPYHNTAVSARHVAECGQRRRAAIASRRTAQIYGLDILVENINTSQKNSTRFVVVSKTPHSTGNKASIAFTLPHVSGSLYKALSFLAESGVNLLKIESRPIVDTAGEFMFFADFEGKYSSENVRAALDRLTEYAKSIRILGFY